jgi:hypothetical protein
MFATRVARCMVDYPLHIVERVVEQLPLKQAWPPNLKEINDALRDAQAEERTAQRFERESQASSSEQRRQTPPTGQKKTYEQLQAELAEVGIFIGGRGQRRVVDDAAAFRARFGLTEAQWNALPNLPTHVLRKEV